MTDLNKEREAFEYWADAKCYYLDKREDGHYEKGSTALAWEIAQYFMAVGRNQELEKAKAQAVPEGYVVVPFKLTNIDANRLAEIEFKESETLFKLENRGLTESEIAVRKSRWLEWKADQIKESHSKVTKFISESGAEG